MERYAYPKSFVEPGKFLPFELRILLLDKPDFSNLAAAAIVAQAGFAMPGQLDPAGPCCFTRDVKLQRLGRPGLLDQRMDGVRSQAWQYPFFQRLNLC